jgi:DNA primase
MLFNADFLRRDGESILVVEGEKKSIIGAQTGFANVGLMGKSGFKPEWAAKFARFKAVNVALDPDALDQAAEIAALFGDRGRVIYLYDKLDDMIVKHGATAEDIEWCIRQGRKA